MIACGSAGSHPLHVQKSYQFRIGRGGGVVNTLGAGPSGLCPRRFESCPRRFKLTSFFFDVVVVKFDTDNK